MIHDYKNIIKKVLDGKWQEFAVEPFNVSFTNRNSPTIFVGDYDQIKSKRFAPEVDFFRGMIIDSVSNNILCMPYTRSYNVQEDLASFKKDFKKATYTLEDKVDGSLIKVYRNSDNKWTIATRGTSEATNEIWTDDLLVEGTKTTYQELFLKTAGITYDDLVVWCDHKQDILMAKDPNLMGFTFLFELCTKLNKVVLDYDKDCIFFHGISVLDLQTYSIDVFKATALAYLIKDANPFYRMVKVLANIQGSTYDSVEEILTRIDEILASYGDGKLVEGCIIHKFIPRPEEDNGEIHQFKDEYFKYKTNQYVVAHKLRGNSGSLNLGDAIEMYLTNEQHEFLSYFPEYQFIFDNVDAIVKDMKVEIEAIFVKWNSLKNDWTKTEREIKKEFFLMTTGHKYFHCIMNKYAHPNQTVIDYLRGCTNNGRVDFFEKLGVTKRT